MENNSHYLPCYVRSYILALKESGEKYATIVEKVAEKYDRNISTGTITKIGNKFENTNSVADLPKTGRPRIFTEEEEESIIMTVLEDRKTTAVDIYRDPKLNKSNATERTIQNVLSRDGLMASARLPEYIPPDSKHQRLLFAEKYSKEPNIWSKVIFSDESDIFPYKAGKLYVRCYRGETDVERYDMRIKWDPRTVKVWGYLIHFGVGPLIRYHDTLNGKRYLEILEEVLLKYYPKLRGTSTRAGGLLFQQDGAKPHVANSVQKWFKEQKIYTLEWPPSSPDLSPIENLWAFLQDELYKKNDVLKDAEDVWRETQKIWYNELNTYVDNLYKSMPNRMIEVIKHKGNRISY